MMLVPLSSFIEYEMSQASWFSLVYGENYKLYTLSSKDVDYSLTKQEEKKVHAFTKNIAVHLAMIKWPEGSESVNKNISDVVNQWLIPIYKVCHKKHVPIGNAIQWNDNKLFLKTVRSELVKHGGYVLSTDKDNSLLIYLTDLVAELNKASVRNTQLDTESMTELLKKVLEI